MNRCNFKFPIKCFQASEYNYFGPHGFKLGGAKLGHIGKFKYGSIGGIKAGRIGGLHYGSIGKLYGHSLLGAANPNAEEGGSDMGSPADAGSHSEHGHADHGYHSVGMEQPGAMYDNQNQEQMVGAPNPNSMPMQEYGMMQPQMNSMMEMARAANEGQMMGANGMPMPMHQPQPMDGSNMMGRAMMYADDGQMVGAAGPNTMPMMGGQEMSPYAMYVNQDQMLALSRPTHEHEYMMHQSMYNPSNIATRSANPYHMMRADGMSMPGQMPPPMPTQHNMGIDHNHMMVGMEHQHQASPAMYGQHDQMLGAPAPTVISMSSQSRKREVC